MKIKKIIYVTNCRMPTERALGLVIVKLCERFASRGIKVELIHSFRINKIKDDPFDYYQIPKNFKIKKIFSLDLIPLFGRHGFRIQYISFSILSTLYLLLKGEVFRKQVIFFSNDYLPLFFLSFFTKNIYHDVHGLVSSPSFYRLFLPRLAGMVTTNKFMRSELIKKYGVLPKKIIHFPNAIDSKEFDISLDKIECREKLGLPQGRKLIFYVGQLFAWNIKGAKTLAESSQFLPKDTQVYFVGGMEQDIKKLKSLTSEFKVNIVGYRPHAEIPYWLKAADILVLPNTAKDHFSKYYTSPLKMFEYMAAERPIVASDLPSIRDILNEENAVFFEPDNAKSLALAIKQLLEDVNLAKKITHQGHQDVQQYTWDNRAKHILDLINSNLYGGK